MKEVKRLEREEMKQIKGGTSKPVTYTCKDGKTFEGGNICDPASHICDSDGGVKFCNG